MSGHDCEVGQWREVARTDCADCRRSDAFGSGDDWGYRVCDCGRYSQEHGTCLCGRQR